MTYRDELGQAHEKIAHLEAELAATRAPKPKPSGTNTAIIILLSVGMALVLMAAAVYATLHKRPKRVGVVQLYDVDGPIPVGVPVKIRGDVVPGSEKLKVDPCDVEFSMARKRAVLDVHSSTCPPDTFARSGFSVIIDGTLSEDRSHFEATAVRSVVKDFPDR